MRSSKSGRVSVTPRLRSSANAVRVTRSSTSSTSPSDHFSASSTAYSVVAMGDDAIYEDVMSKLPDEAAASSLHGVNTGLGNAEEIVARAHGASSDP